MSYSVIDGLVLYTITIIIIVIILILRPPAELHAKLLHCDPLRVDKILLLLFYLVWTFSSVCLATDWKEVRPLIALHCLLLVLVSTPLRIVNRCCFGFPVSGDIEMSRPLTFLEFGCTGVLLRV